MNDINSVILEGTVNGNVIFYKTKNNTVCELLIAVKRFYKNENDEQSEEISHFVVIAYGNIAKFCHDRAKNGMGIRVVGRLKENHYFDSDNNKHSKIVVLAEHIEYKYTPKKD